MNNYNTLITSALDHLKKQKKISISDVAERIEEKRRTLYNIRNGIVTGSPFVWNKIKEEFPEITKQDWSNLEEPEVEYKYQNENVWKELAEARKKLVETLEAENARLSTELAKSKLRVKELEGLISERKN